MGGAGCTVIVGWTLRGGAGYMVIDWALRGGAGCSGGCLASG